jgi:tetratricopeptide (TPR) repeat protein
VAAVREAVGVAAYHAGDFAEAAREIRAYRRMSGDQGYRAVLADCERALGRADVALRLVAEALADRPDADESLELRMVEAGARRDLGEDAAARLVLESAFGGRPDPAALDAADPARVRLAAAYAELLQAQGEGELAETWLAAVAAADPDNLTGAVEGPGIEFIDLEEEFDDTSEETAAPEVVEELPEDRHDLGKSFDEEVEAEVAELLGESEPGDDQH